MHTSFEQIQERCRRSLFDICWTNSRAPRTIGLHAAFEDYGDYFTIWAKDVSFVQLAACVSIWGGIELLSLATLRTRLPSYSRLAMDHSGEALVLWETQGPLEEAPADEVFVIVAEEFAFELGKDFYTRG